MPKIYGFYCNDTFCDGRNFIMLFAKLHLFFFFLWSMSALIDIVMGNEFMMTVCHRAV